MIFSPSGPSMKPRMVSTMSSSTIDAPTSPPLALSSVKHIPPPMSMASTLGRRFSMTPSLSETLAPPRTTT